ncbi:hypothetical protein BDF21DRAFT_469216 [Thamnidium elegans]|uniref:Uncharacterized protein n=1 Tax=Thamnidium elegans TaxID=101142 RepID=A0A8H7SXF0_9FUNG|nr:hypothetical protein INT48_008114 [Thamnidium elegans]KAI8047884.1 hypothetical protein BDF21DRAFT_469216 [Thamnidium elegans]
MTELTEQEKLERRRQKRQQRILQSGESRLGKITGTAFPNRHTPSPTPSPSTSLKNNTEPITLTPSSSLKPEPVSFRTQRRDSDDPSEELGAPEPLVDQDMNVVMNQAFASMFGGVAGIPGSEGGFNPASLLSAMGGGEMPDQAAAEHVQDSTRYWNLLHLLVMVMLGVYSVYFEWTRAGSDRFAALLYKNVSNYPTIHVPVFWYFVTLELCLQSARLFYQKGTMPPTSTLATLATQLPHPFGNAVTVFLRYRLIWTCLVQDICVLVFIIGLSQVVSNVF